KCFDILGMGGIKDEEDVLEFIMAGANAVSIGTTLFVYELSIDKIITNLQEKMRKLNISSVQEIVGCINN
ncbi:MAG: dihydroorotate dehydrogenase, partial [Nitrospinae bacterium]|nr:dihydroorotate dehydrogenase [Nitrospinota bacterium]